MKPRTTRTFPSQSTDTSSRSPAHHPSPTTHRPTAVRLNKFFTQLGICCRREADRWIAERRITLNGRVAVLGDQVNVGDRVAFDGREIPWGNPPIYLIYHKPLGVTTTTELDVPGNIIA